MSSSSACAVAFEVELVDSDDDVGRIFSRARRQCDAWRRRRARRNGGGFRLM